MGKTYAWKLPTVSLFHAAAVLHTGSTNSLQSAEFGFAVSPSKPCDWLLNQSDSIVYCSVNVSLNIEHGLRLTRF